VSTDDLCLKAQGMDGRLVIWCVPCRKAIVPNFGSGDVLAHLNKQGHGAKVAASRRACEATDRVTAMFQRFRSAYGDGKWRGGSVKPSTLASRFVLLRAMLSEGIPLNKLSTGSLVLQYLRDHGTPGIATSTAMSELIPAVRWDEENSVRLELGVLDGCRAERAAPAGPSAGATTQPATG